MALDAFDGTWNCDEDIPAQDMNMVRFKGLYSGSKVKYCEGVGTRRGAALTLHFANKIAEEGVKLENSAAECVRC